MKYWLPRIIEIGLLLLPTLLHCWPNRLLHVISALLLTWLLNGDLYQILAACMLQPLSENSLIPLGLYSIQLTCQQPWLVSLLFNGLLPALDGSDAWFMSVLYKYLMQTIEWAIGNSLTFTERGFICMALTRLLMVNPCDVDELDSSSVIYILICIPLLCLLPFVPLVTKITTTSAIVGKHRRPKNWDRLKLRYSCIMYVGYPALVLGIETAFLGIDGVKDLLHRLIIENDALLFYWTGLLSFAICILMLWHRFAPVSTQSSVFVDMHRKFWHFLVVLMFLPVVSNPATSAWLSIAFVVFLLLELVRACTLPPFGLRLHQLLMIFVDHRDKRGPMIISHVFLLIGIGVPILLEHSPLGLIMLGLGDSSASLIGRSFGRHRIGGSSKTVEGTLAFATAAFVGLYFFSDVSFNLVPVVACACALLEAVSPVNDNLLIPIYSLALTLNFEKRQ